MIKLLPAVATVVSLLLPGAACADSYPAEPLRIIVPYAPGGIADVLARLVGSRMEATFKQPVTVENRAGANGTIAQQFVAAAKPDGYTLLLGNTSTQVVNAHLYTKLSFNIAKAFQPVGLIAASPMMLVVSASSPSNSVADLLAAARASAVPLNFGSAGNGSASHLSLLKSGKLKAIGVASREAQPALPGIAPIAATLPGFEMTTWLGLFAPAGTPRERIDRLNSVLRSILEESALRQQLIDQGNEVRAGSAADFEAFIAAEMTRIGELIRAASIKLDN